MDKIFLGGSKSNQFLDHIKQLEVLVCDSERCVKSFNTPIARNEAANLGNLEKYIGEIRINLSQANSFSTCLLEQNTKDQDAAFHSISGIICMKSIRLKELKLRIKLSSFIVVS